MTELEKIEGNDIVTEASEETTCVSTAKTNEPVIFTSSDQPKPKASKSGSTFFARLLFLIVAVVALPLSLLLFFASLSLFIATLIILFYCFALLGGLFYPELCQFLVSMQNKYIPCDVIKYYTDTIFNYLPLSGQYAPIAYICLQFVGAIIVLAIGFFILKIGKLIWQGLGTWRNKLSH